MSAAKRAGDIVVLSIHWGANWGYSIPAAQRAFAHRLIDTAGVDVVHGHSSHHPKRIEIYRTKPILYGCGDFLNDYEGIGGHESFRPKLTLMYFATIDAATGALTRLTLTPMRIRHFRAQRAGEEDARWLAEMLSREGEKLGAHAPRAKRTIRLSSSGARAIERAVIGQASSWSMKSAPLRLTLLGVGAMNSPRYAPAGLLVESGSARIMLDGGPSAASDAKLNAWLVTDEHGELIREIRKLARSQGLQARVDSFSADDFVIEPRAVVHTSHNAYGYVIATPARKIVWAPEFFEFPAWAQGADIMFAEAASWSHPIRFRGGMGGHAPVLDVARRAQEQRVKRLVYAHIGRPTIRAIEAGLRPPFGEFGKDGAVYLLGRDF